MNFNEQGIQAFQEKRYEDAAQLLHKQLKQSQETQLVM